MAIARGGAILHRSEEEIIRGTGRPGLFRRRRRAPGQEIRDEGELAALRGGEQGRLARRHTGGIRGSGGYFWKGGQGRDVFRRHGRYHRAGSPPWQVAVCANVAGPPAQPSPHREIR